MTTTSENPVISYDPDSTLYPIYKSGSMGNPNGAMIKTNSYINLLHWYLTKFAMTEMGHILLMAPLNLSRS